jgi:hypothetical protein
MPISNSNPELKDLVIIQRDDTNSYYGETHISGSNLLLYIDSDGRINADDSGSFYTLFPPSGSIGGGGGGSGTTLGTGSTYPITSSWAINTVNGGSGTTLGTGSTYPITASSAISASWAPSGGGGGTTLITGSTYQITSSWTNNITSSGIIGNITSFSSSWSSQSLSASYAPFTDNPNAVSASWASSSISSSYITASNIDGIVSSASYANTASYISSSNIDGIITAISASWASSSISASYAPSSGGDTSLTTGSTYPITSSWADTASIALNSIGSVDVVQTQFFS